MPRKDSGTRLALPSDASSHTSSLDMCAETVFHCNSICGCAWAKIPVRGAANAQMSAVLLNLLCMST